MKDKKTLDELAEEIRRMNAAAKQRKAQRERELMNVEAARLRALGHDVPDVPS